MIIQHSRLLLAAALPDACTQDLLQVCHLSVAGMPALVSASVTSIYLKSACTHVVYDMTAELAMHCMKYRLRIPQAQYQCCQKLSPACLVTH